MEGKRGANGGRDRLSKGSKGREKSILWKEYAHWRIKLQENPLVFFAFRKRPVFMWSIKSFTVQGL